MPSIAASNQMSAQANEWFERGRNYFLGDEYDEALKMLDRAIALVPNFAQAYYYRGLVRNKKGEYDKAIDDLSKAMAIDPVFSWTYFYRGVVYLQLGKKGKPILDMQEAARLGNKEAQSWLKKGKDEVKEK